jgi:hypothetical protein
MEKKNPFHSTIINFGRAVRGQNFASKVIAYWFNKLVDPDDYSRKDKKELMAWLEEINKEPEAGIKSGVTYAWRLPKLESKANLLPL